jgi:hypothetical protein
LADLLVLIARFIEYSGAMILFGSSLFLLYGGPIASDPKSSDLIWAKHLLIGAGMAMMERTPHEQSIPSPRKMVRAPERKDD